MKSGTVSLIGELGQGLFLSLLSNGLLACLPRLRMHVLKCVWSDGRGTAWGACGMG